MQSSIPVLHSKIELQKQKGKLVFCKSGDIVSSVAQSVVNFHKLAYS